VRIAYWDCFSGISGDMALGALVGAGLSRERLLELLSALDLTGYDLEVETTRRNGLAATRVCVRVQGSPSRRDPAAVRDLILASRLPARVREQSLAVFDLLAQSEARVHGIPVEEVHFHEVGAVDAIVDIVGTVAGLHALDVDRVLASAVNVGSGTVHTDHGPLPVPAPATEELLKTKPTYAAGPAMELTTPTGAALIAGLAGEGGPRPLLAVEAVGYGAGRADPPGWTNCLRLLVGRAHETLADTCWLLETTIDDATPETVAYAMERLLEAGALDVFATPAVMKKARGGQVLHVLAAEGDREVLTEILFRETPTLGVRRQRVARDTLRREIRMVRTPYGEVPVKAGFLGDRGVTLSPEYEACRRLAREQGIPFREVYQAALAAAREAEP